MCDSPSVSVFPSFCSVGQTRSIILPSLASSMATEMKTALIVFAHESKESFSTLAKNEAEAELKRQGFRVDVSDLYAMKFKVSATAEDIVDNTQEDFDYEEATEQALHDGKLSKDIVDEQRKLKDADLVIFQFPMYWFSAPAIVKGWIDRVLTKGFAYADGKGLLNNKRALISFTTGSQESMFRARSINGELKFDFIPVLHRAMFYCGFKVLEPQVFKAPPLAADERKTLLEDWVRRLQGITTEEPADPLTPEISQDTQFELKNVLIVYAHQSSKSFNASAKEAAKKTLEAKGCAVEVSDLYALLSKGVVDDAKPLDILEEQRKLEKADLVVFQFPMYWFSVPAILKDWIDKVLTKGFAYTDKECFSEGLFTNKRALLSFTTGTQKSMFAAEDATGGYNYTLCPLLQGALTYCGFKVLKPQIFWSPASESRDARTEMLTSWEERLKVIAKEKPLKPQTWESAASQSSEDRKKSGV